MNHAVEYNANQEQKQVEIYVAKGMVHKWRMKANSRSQTPVQYRGQP